MRAPATKQKNVLPEVKPFFVWADGGVCKHIVGKSRRCLPREVGWTSDRTVGTAAAATAAAGLKAAGFYAITSAATGATMLGSAAGGVSAAGTVGIMGGTAGTVGTVAAALMFPFVIVPAAVVAGGVGVYEAGCYLTDKDAKKEPRGSDAKKAPSDSGAVAKKWLLRFDRHRVCAAASPSAVTACAHSIRRSKVALGSVAPRFNASTEKNAHLPTIVRRSGRGGTPNRRRNEYLPGS